MKCYKVLVLLLILLCSRNSFSAYTSDPCEAYNDCVSCAESNHACVWCAASRIPSCRSASSIFLQIDEWDDGLVKEKCVGVLATQDSCESAAQLLSYINEVPAFPTASIESADAILQTIDLEIDVGAAKHKDNSGDTVYKIPFRWFQSERIHIHEPQHGNTFILSNSNGEIEIKPKIWLQNTAFSKLLHVCVRLFSISASKLYYHVCLDQERSSRKLPIVSIRSYGSFILEVSTISMEREDQTSVSSVFEIVPNSWSEYSAYFFRQNGDASRHLFENKYLKKGFSPSLMQRLITVSDSLLNEGISQQVEMMLKYYSKRESTGEKTSKIPKIIHQVWIQGEEHLKRTNPNLFKMMEGWKSFHPDWKHILWDSNSMRNLLQTDKSISWAIGVYDRLDHFIKQVDFFRYLVLFRFGGVTIDMDIECVQNLSLLFESNPGFSLYVGEEESPRHREYSFLPRYTVNVSNKNTMKLERNTGLVTLGRGLEPYEVAGTKLYWQTNNAWVASSMFHPAIYWTCVEVVRRFEIIPNFHVLKATGPVLLTQTLEAFILYHRNTDIAILPKATFFSLEANSPEEWLQRHTLKQKLINKGTFGIHYYAQSWVKDYEQKVFFKSEL